MDFRIINTEQEEDIYGDAEATVVKLSPNQGVVAVSFDEAFGEYSEARGDRRKRRYARKMERVQMKRELRKAKGEARGERQMDRQKRKTDRMSARQERKSLRSDARQARKTSRVSARQERRGMKALGRVQRKELSNAYKEPELQEEEVAVEEQGYAQEPSRAELPSRGGREEIEDDYTTEDSYVGEGEDRYNNEDDSLVENEGGDEGVTDEDSYSQEDDYVSDEAGDDSSFNGEASGDASIDPRVKAAAMRVEWHRNKIEKLKRAIDGMRVTNGAGQMRRVQMMREIGKHNQSMQNINSGLDEYASSGADGENRAAMVNAARKKAYMARMAYKRKKMVTPVQRQLKPEISPNRVVINPTSSADGATVNVGDLKMNDDEVGLTGGTGVIALDATNDEGAPETKIVDVNYSNASGDGKGGNMVLKVAAGIAVGVAAIYLIKKYKLIK